VVAEKREVEISKDTQIERLVFEELQKGPKSEGLVATIPKGTRLYQYPPKTAFAHLIFPKSSLTTIPAEQQVKQ